MKVLTIDVGGTNVKILATGQRVRRKFPSGPTLTPSQMVSTVKKLARDWEYEAVSIGYPGRFCTDDQLRNHVISLRGGSPSISRRHSDVQ